MKSISPEMVALYEKLKQHTLRDCNRYCDVRTCCKKEYCEEARRFAHNEYGVTLEDTGHPDLPFMAATGCVVAAHLRPQCTEYVCCVATHGGRASDPKWTQEYFAIRKRIFWLQLAEKKKCHMDPTAKNAP